MSRSRTLLSALIVPAAITLSATPASAAIIFNVDLGALNDSGVTGSGTFTLADDSSTLTVNLTATGLEPGQVHVGHIHGLFSEGATGTPVNSTVPGPQQDTDGDGFVELAEGSATYGPVLLEFGNVDPDGDGIVDYMQTFNLLDPATFAAGFDITDLLGPDLMSLDLREVVIHGMTVPPGPGAGTPGEVNGTNGYLTVLPVTSGEITRATAAVPEPGTWAMMLMGFGTVGFTMRRRKKALVQTA